MAFRKPGWLMVALVSALMAGCGSKTEPSKSNFANAIEDHLEKDGRFCVGKSFKFPVHLENKGTFGGPDNERMQILEKAGLVKCRDAGMGSTCELTADSEPFQKSVASPLGGEDSTTFCYGKMELDEVKKWEAPGQGKEVTAAKVIYSVKVDDVPDWAKEKHFVRAFPEAKRTANTDVLDKEVAILKLTSEGWEVVEIPNMSFGGMDFGAMLRQ